MKWTANVINVNANKVGERTEPCLTPNSMLNVAEYKPSHLMHVTQPLNKLIMTFNRTTGIRLFISFIYKAWWLTLSKALAISIAHKLTVLPLLTKLSTMFRTANIAWLQLTFFLKPYWLSLKYRNEWYCSRMQCSKTFDKMGLMVYRPSIFYARHAHLPLLT